MRYHKRKSTLRITLGVLFLLLLNFYSFSWWFANGTPVGFTGNPAIQSDVVTGGGYFLDSYILTLSFMQKTELSVFQGLNYDELSGLLDRAAESMKLANETYAGLKQAADNTPYNQTVIEALKYFDYDSLQKTLGLDAAAFSEVKSYLVNGDIRGVYGKILADTGKIISLLKPVKSAIAERTFPALTEVWNLNQAYSRLLLFGQYVSTVFHHAVPSSM